MPRHRTTIAVFMLCLVMAGVVVAVRHLIRRDQAALVAQFAAEHLRRVDEAVREIEEDLDDIGEDLRFASQLIQAAESSSDREREIRALLAVVKEYRLVEVYGRDARRVVSVRDPLAGAAFAPDAFEEAMASTASRAALRPPGQVETSPPIAADARGWFRVFATALPANGAAGGGSVGVLVDTEPYFGRLRLASADDATRLLLLGPHNRPTPATHPALEEAIARLAPAPRSSAGLAALVRRMGRGDRGTFRVSESEATDLGLARAELIAAYAPIRVTGGKHWAAATLTSTAALRKHERAIVLRVATASGAIGICLVAFGAWMFVASKRSFALREELRHAGTLAQLHAQLLRAEKLATVGVLGAGVAHEMGTPLGVIRGRAEYVLGKIGDDHPQAAGMRVIVEQIDCITRTIRKLLDFARSRPPVARAVSLPAASRSVVDLLHYETSRKKVSVDVETAEDLPPIAADPDQLQQVLVNLVMNACDACAEGGRVVLLATAMDGNLLVEVADDGCGIEPDSLLHVFDPFFTTKRRGRGTGLGLTIAAQIVRNHGGRIEIQSTAGKGTRVSTTWPVATGIDREAVLGDAG